MSTIQQNLQNVRSQIEAIAQRCARNPNEVTLLAVSKTKPVEAIAEAIAAGQYVFGENYVQEGIDKIQYFTQCPETRTLEWHFIGPLQANKTRSVAEHFSWCHTIDRLRIAQRLSDQRPAGMAALNLLIQVNISHEPNKSGICLDELPSLAEAVSALPNVKLRGLMAIPAPEVDYQRQLAVFNQLNEAFQTLKQCYPHIDTLSMGMSDDMDAAIMANSTMVRIGTAIFGKRSTTKSE